MHIVQQYNEGIDEQQGKQTAPSLTLHAFYYNILTLYIIGMLPEQFTVSGWIYSSASRIELKAQICCHKILQLFHLLSHHKWAGETRDPSFYYQDVFSNKSSLVYKHR